jgi:hypothetical protein
MKVNRKDLLWFIQNIRRKNESVTDEELVNELGNWIETNPRCIDMNAVSHSGRYSYRTVGYGVMSLFGERYRMGRIEIFDKEDRSGWAVAEGDYSIPFVAANQFEDFIESLETDLPIHIEIGSHKWCEEECAKDLGFKDAEEMRDQEKVKEYRKNKNDEYAREKGYKDWDDLLANSKFLNPNKNE